MKSSQPPFSKGGRGGIWLEGGMRFADLTGGVIVLLLGVAVIFFSRQLPYQSSIYGPGPGFLPFWLGMSLIGCAIFVILNVLKEHDKTRAFFQPRTKLTIKILIIIVITFLLFPLLGFPIGLGLFTAFNMRMMGKHGWILCGLTAIVTAIGIHFIFRQWLYIPLPRGIIGW